MKHATPRAECCEFDLSVWYLFLCRLAVDCSITSRTTECWCRAIGSRCIHFKLQRGGFVVRSISDSIICLYLYSYMTFLLVCAHQYLHKIARSCTSMITSQPNLPNRYPGSSRTSSSHNFPQTPSYTGSPSSCPTPPSALPQRPKRSQCSSSDSPSIFQSTPQSQRSSSGTSPG